MALGYSKGISDEVEQRKEILTTNGSSGPALKISLSREFLYQMEHQIEIKTNVRAGTVTRI